MSGARPVAPVVALLLAGIASVLILYVARELVVARDASPVDGRIAAEVLALLTMSYDNDPLDDRLVLPPHPELGGAAVHVFRARESARPAGLVMTIEAPDGYRSAIGLAVGIDVGGSLTGVRMLHHGETEAIGGLLHQERSDWLSRFAGRGLDDPPEAMWTLRTQGGEFDAWTGATVTSNAILRAVHRCLRYHAANRDALYARVQ